MRLLFAQLDSNDVSNPLFQIHVAALFPHLNVLHLKVAFFVST
jgi:hypothetical protein